MIKNYSHFDYVYPSIFFIYACIFQNILMVVSFLHISVVGVIIFTL